MGCPPNASQTLGLLANTLNYYSSSACTIGVRMGV